MLFGPNDVEGFVRMFLSVEDARLRELAARGVAKVAREYTWDIITNRLVGIYSDVCEEYQGRVLSLQR